MADITDVVNFDLLLMAAPGGYRARVVDSPAGEATSGFTLPSSDLEVENLILRLTQRSAGMRRLESVEVGVARVTPSVASAALLVADRADRRWMQRCSSTESMHRWAPQCR